MCSLASTFQEAFFRVIGNSVVQSAIFFSKIFHDLQFTWFFLKNKLVTRTNVKNKEEVFLSFFFLQAQTF